MKNFLIPAFVLLTAPAFSQCSDLFFSEYLEGTSNNKAIEIYNPTPTTVNLTDYVIYRYNNGSPTPSDSLFPQGTLAAGQVWVAGNPSAVTAILNVSDTLHTITFFNGDDAMSLKNRSTNTVLDIIGIIGVDPGTNWPVGSGATSEFTLVRNTGTQEGNVNWAVAATEYDVYAQNTFTFLGNHTMTPCCTPATVSLASSANNPCYGDSLGTISVNGSGDGPLTYSWVNLPYTTQTLVNLAAGTYSAVVTGACGSDTLAVTITEPAVLSDSLVSFSDPFCNTSNGMLQITGVGGVFPYSYAWNTGDTDDSISGVPAGTYYAVITDANGCTDTLQFQLNNPPAPVVTVSLAMDTLCYLNSPPLALSGENPAGGTWSGNGVNGSVFYGDTAGLGWHVITYTYTDSSNCAGTATDSIFVDICSGVADVAATDFILSPNPFADQFTLTFGSSDARVVEVFSIHGELVKSLSTTATQTTVDLSDAATGIYVVRISDGNSYQRMRVIKQ